MALTPPLIYQALAANRFSGGIPFAGPSYDALALGLANGVSLWAVAQAANLALVGTATGTAGAGAITPVTSKLLVPPNVGAMQAALSGAGVNGPLSVPLAIAVTLGISQAFSTYAQYLGFATGVGVGNDVSKVAVANPTSLIGILEGSLRSVMGVGPALTLFSVGFGNGIAALLLGGTGTAMITGATTGVPAVGGTFSTVV